MNGETRQRQVTITNPQGFHMRPATAFAQRASQFASSVTICKDERRVNGKSPLELLLLAAEQGTELTLIISGTDADAAMTALEPILTAPSADDIPEPPSTPNKPADAKPQDG
jgi:phosphotransferase system HPr (HPr) family protein